MLQKLRLRNFRAFRDFTVPLSQGAYLVGPNNAGKSTILTALRVADSLLREAHRRQANQRFQDEVRWVQGAPVSLTEFPSLRESIRHEFHNEMTRLELTWQNTAKLTAVWPESSNGELQGFFYLESVPGIQPRTVRQVKETFSSIGIIPILTPVEHTEGLLTDTYVRRNLSGRLASRHFRNQLLLLQQAGQFEEFREYASPWLGEVRLEKLEVVADDEGSVLDLYLREEGSRVPKELVWAGDGVQVWLQILFHVYRLHSSPTIILDEPEVYLHPDLQRRAVQLLESLGRQVVMATHSSEIIAEVPTSQVVWIDKGRRRGTRAKDESVLQQLSDAIGTNFNLRLAKALRAKVALFVEGQDFKVLKKLASVVGASRVAREASSLAIIPLLGYSHHSGLDAFKWLTKDLLANSLRIFVVLDRDYRPDEEVRQVERELDAIGIVAHVWQRKEIESYLLEDSVLARAAGAPETEIEGHIDAISLSLENEVFARMLDERVRFERSAKRHDVSIMSDFKKEFDQGWVDPHWRREVCPPKVLLAKLNSELQARRRKAVSIDKLASVITEDEVSAEVRSLLHRVDNALSA